MAVYKTTHGRARAPRKAALKAALAKQPATRAVLQSTVQNPGAAGAGPVDPYKERVDAATKLRFGGQEAQLAQRARDVPAYFKQYQDTIAATTAANRQAAERAAGQFSGLVAGLSAADQARQSQVDEQMRLDAERRGATADPAAGQVSANAASVRRDMLASLAGVSNIAGQTQANQDSQAARSAQGQMVGAQQALAGKLADLQAEKGAFATSLRNDLQGADEKAAADKAADELKFKQALAIAGINADTDLAQTKLTTSASRANAKTSASTSRANALTSAKTSRERTAASTAAAEAKINKYGYPESEWRAMTTAQRQKVIDAHTPAKTPAKPRTGLGSLTQGEENTLRAKLDKLYGQLASSKSDGSSITLPDGKTKIKNSDGAILNALQAAGLSRDGALVVLSRYRNKGALGASGVKAANRIGLHVGGRYKLVKTGTSPFGAVKQAGATSSLGTK